MRTDVLDNAINAFEKIWEHCLEWAEYIKYRLFNRKERQRRLIEEYFIKKEYSDDRSVKTFLAERRKTIERNRYNMIVQTGYTSERNEELGKVTLSRKGKYIDHATLILGPETGGGNRLIFWDFNKDKTVTR